MSLQNPDNEPWVTLLKMNGYIILAKQVEDMAESVCEQVKYHEGKPGSLWRSWGVTSHYDINRFQMLGEADERAVYDAIRQDKGELERQCDVPHRGTFLPSNHRYNRKHMSDSQNPDT
jgi:hypothetical protein